MPVSVFLDDSFVDDIVARSYGRGAAAPGAPSQLPTRLGQDEDMWTHRRTRRARVSAALVVAGATALALSACGPYAPDLPTPPLALDEIVGTWTAPDAGTVVFGHDGSFTAEDVPARAIGSTETDTRRISKDGTWSLDDDRGLDWKILRISCSDGTAPDWMIRGSAGHRELDLIVGDPDQVDWVRLKRAERTGG
jgi:hypothetical protein